METVQLIDQILKEKLSAQHVGIIDDSDKHRGHKAAGGGGHFTVTVVSECFRGINIMINVVWFTVHWTNRSMVSLN